MARSSSMFLAGAALLLGCGASLTTFPPAPGEVRPLADLEARGLRPVEVAPTPSGPPFVLTGATVRTVAGATHAPGWVRVEAGRITGVGAGDPPSAAGDHVIDARGMVVTPGLIDIHSHLGVYPAPSANAHSDGNEMTDPITAGVWAEHSFWPEDPGIEQAVAGGVTTLQALPGSGNLVGGRGVILHLSPARGARAMRLPGAPETVKMACGENPKRVYGEAHRSPSTRMGSVRDLREALLAARRYGAEWAKWEAETLGPGVVLKAPVVPPVRDLEMETLAAVLRGEILPQVHCYRADDMLGVLQVADELGFQIAAFHHALEAYKIRDVLAERGVAVATWADWWGFKMEALDGIPENAALVTEAGARAIIHSDSDLDIQRLNQEASKALAAGRAAHIPVDEDDALAWITLNPATALGIAGEVGSIEVGKRADLVVWTADPLSVYARARWVFIDGALRHDSQAEAAPWSDFLLGQGGAP